MMLHRIFRELCILARARRVYLIRYERLLHEHELSLHEATQSVALSTWTRDDIVELASLTVSRKLEAARKRARTVKAARAARRRAKTTRKENAK